MNILNGKFFIKRVPSAEKEILLTGEVVKQVADNHFYIRMFSPGGSVEGHSVVDAQYLAYCRFYTSHTEMHRAYCDAKPSLQKKTEEPEKSLLEAKPWVVVRMNDVIDQLKDREVRWRSEKRVGAVGYDEETEAVLFYFDEKTEAYRYYIHLSRFDTTEKQMAWINHLRHKRWFKRDVLNDFFDVLERLGILDKRSAF